ncbi:MAG: hypothetical protein HXX08_14245 [Chloroflexi bacterium]|uniref:Lipoprotein n=1 Tax=Candidatus Chlorohelix allophototropha TaxID=3003348 RepID=A0A8T7M4M8_9CHLR|nr:hypothetical protein [Chloroflexota bacterium]WJW70331.1 hypothetical protein OZ401_005065 [Chloroflexota bacterium L227-S17]
MQKLKRIGPLLLLSLILLVACGEPTATPVPPTATPIPPTATPVPPTATPIPPTATPVPTATPIPPTATPIPSPTPVPTTYDGNWDATASDGTQIAFNVQKNMFVYFALREPCTNSSPLRASYTIEKTSLKGTDFSWEITYTDKFVGKFESPESASGELIINMDKKVNGCPGARKITWKASKTSFASNDGIWKGQVSSGGEINFVVRKSIIPEGTIKLSGCGQINFGLTDIYLNGNRFSFNGFMGNNGSFNLNGTFNGEKGEASGEAKANEASCKADASWTATRQ